MASDLGAVQAAGIDFHEDQLVGRGGTAQHEVTGFQALNRAVEPDIETRGIREERVRLARGGQHLHHGLRWDRRNVGAAVQLAEKGYQLVKVGGLQ